MGLGLFGGISVNRDRSNYGNVNFNTSFSESPNPNPKNFNIMSTRQIGKSLVVEVNYPDCINYEGNKILVFGNCLEKDIRGRITLDPHFSKSNGLIARFAPTVEGLQLAVKLANLIKETK